MKEEIIEQLKQTEKDLTIYNQYLQNPELPKQQSGPVSFKFLYEMIKFKVLNELVPEYKAGETQEVLTASGILDTAKMVSIKDGKVEVSTYFEDLLKMKEKYNNGKIS